MMHAIAKKNEERISKIIEQSDILTKKMLVADEFHKSFTSTMQVHRNECAQQQTLFEGYKFKILEEFASARRDMTLQMDELRLENQKIIIKLNKQIGVNQGTNANFDLYQKFVVDAVKDLTIKKAEYEEEMNWLVGLCYRCGRKQ